MSQFDTLKIFENQLEIDEDNAKQREASAKSGLFESVNKKETT